MILWIAIFGLLFMWRAQNLDAFGLSNDEGAHLMWAQLAVDGYPLYEETRAVQQPLFLGWLAWAFRLLEPTIVVGRSAILASFGLWAATLSWLAYRAGGWVAALVALILLGVSPLVFSLSRLVMAEVPAVALATLSIALLLVFLERGRRLWLAASGLALGLSLMVKMLNPFVVVPVGLLLWLRAGAGSRESRRRLSLLREGVWWGGGVLTPVVAVLLVYEPAALYEQLVAFRGDLRAAIPGSWIETRLQFQLFLQSHWGFWLLAGGGVISAFGGVGIRKNPGCGGRPAQASKGFLSFPPYPLVWGVWLGAGLAMLVWHTPLFPHHFVVLLPPLILLGAGFTADVVALWRRPGRRRAVAVILTFTGGLALANAPAMVEANQKTAAIVTGGREAQAIELLQAVSHPDDFIVGDSQLLIFMAGRRTPPPLGDVALVAIKAGWQTSERLITLTRSYQVPAVVQWSLRLPWLPDYLAWSEANYLARRVWDNDHIIYFVPRIPAGQAAPNDRRVRLGDSILLRGYEVDRAASDAGQNLNVNLYWQTEGPLSHDYTVFIQLLDQNGRLVAGRDRQPLGGYFPTSRWPVDEIITDVAQLPVPADLPAGDYTLITGLYLLDTLERLPTTEGPAYIPLTTLTFPKQP